MRSFIELKDLILSFHTAVITHNNKNYVIVTNLLKEDAYGREIKIKVNNAVFDLLSESPIYAKNKVNFLKSLITELSEFRRNILAEELALDIQNDAFAAWELFQLTCNLRGIDLTESWNSSGPGVEIVTPNFLDDLIEEIEARKYLVSCLSEGISRAVDNYTPDKLKMYGISFIKSNSGVSSNRIIPGELSWHEWNEISSIGSTALNPINIPNSSAGRPKAPCYDFENDILNEAGRRIAAKLKAEYGPYKGDAGRIRSMLQALLNKNALQHTFNAINASSLAQSLNDFLGVAENNPPFSRQSLGDFKGNFINGRASDILPAEERTISDFLQNH